MPVTNPYFTTSQPPQPYNPQPYTGRNRNNRNNGSRGRGRNNMPAQAAVLNADQINVLASYVWGLSHKGGAKQ